METPPTIPIAELRQQLRSAGLDHQFSTVAYEHIGRFSNDVWRLELDNGVTLIAKVPYRPARPGERASIEAKFYSEMREHRGLPIPRFIAEHEGTLVLEYLELSPFSFKRGPSEAHMSVAIDALADWHAAFWQNPPDWPWLPDFADPEFRRATEKNYDQAWTAHRNRLVELLPEFADLGDGLVGRLATTLEPLADSSTLCHGDAHAENISLASSGAYLLDWQDPQIANPGCDLAVFTTMSLPTGKRRELEQDLVDRHASRMAASGCHWPDPWQGYRLGVLRRAARIVEIASEEFSSLPWVFRRSAQAALDHDVSDLIQ